MLTSFRVAMAWTRTLVFAIVISAPESFASLDLHPGLRERWRIRSAREDAFLEVHWTDSTELPGGAVDWRAVLTLRRGDSAQVDTVVLRRFALTHLVETGEFLLGETWGWIRPSCLMPFQRDLDSAVASDLAEILPYEKALTDGDRLLRWMPKGAIQERCRYGDIELDMSVADRGNGSICSGVLFGECDDCGPAPRQRELAGLGTVGWRSSREGEDWRLLRFDGRAVEHPSGRATLWPRRGESWTWTQGTSTNPPLRTLTILSTVPDSAGVPGWNVTIRARDAKGRDTTHSSRLRVDSTESHVQIGVHRSFPWSLSPVSAEANFALGIVRDWATPDVDTTILFENFSHLSCWGNTSSSLSTSMKSARNQGVISLEISSYTGPFQSPTFSSATWSLMQHSLEPTGLPKDRSTGPDRTLLRDRLVADPALWVQRISADGRSEVAHGLAALKFLERTGIAILVVGDGPHRSVMRYAHP